MPIYKAEGKKDGLQKYLVKVSYRDEMGKHDLTRVAYGRSEALQLEERLRKSKKKEPAHIKVNELYKEYIKAKEKEVRETTLDKMKICFRLHILPHIGDIRLDKLTPAVLEREWRRAVSESDLCVSSKNNVYRDLRAFLNYAVRIDAIPSSPLKKVDRFRDPYELPKEGTIQYYTADQFQRYMLSAREKCATMPQWGLFVFFAIAYYTGARKGEINALRWCDVNDGKISIKRSVNVKGKKPRETPPKNKSSFRTIQIPDPLMEILAEQKERQMKFEKFSENWRVCGGPDYLADTTIDKFNRDVASASNLPHIRVHDFRHSHASLLANAGINIQEIARRLGHANVMETWKTYAHLYPQEEERALSVLNSVPTFYRQNVKS